MFFLGTVSVCVWRTQSRDHKNGRSICIIIIDNVLFCSHMYRHYWHKSSPASEASNNRHWPLWGSLHLSACLLEAGCQHAGSPLSSTSGFGGLSASGSPCHDRTSANGTGLPTPEKDLQGAWLEDWVGCSKAGELIFKNVFTNEDYR